MPPKRPATCSARLRQLRCSSTRVGDHLFVDSSTTEYDAGATDTMLARVLQFLGSH